jgi:WD40 repeat protein/serine/threonine protein kinase
MTRSPDQAESPYPDGDARATRSAGPRDARATGSTAGARPDPELVDRILDEYFQRQARGEPVDLETLADGHGEAADALKEYLRGAALIERLLPEGSETVPAHPVFDAASTNRPERIDEYEIIDEIGRGGMGVVYRARQGSTQREVALKVMLTGPFASPRARARFEREMRLAARLDNPHIVSVLAGGTFGGRYYYVMEYVRGEPLDGYAAAHRGAVRELLALFTQVCDAVNFAHQRGVIHRDLKPSNILVDDNGAPHVLDFGLAKSVDPEPDADAFQTQSVPGHIVGTLPYIAPEQAIGSVADVDIRSDVYAIGVMLFEALTGQHPYPTGGSTLDALRTIAEAEVQSPSTLREGLDDEIDAIVLRTLEKSKDRRYQTAQALGDDLRRYLRGESIEAKRHSRTYVLRKALRRYRSQALAALLIFVGLTVFAVTATLLYFQAERQRLTAESLSGQLAQTARQLGRELHLGNLQRGRAMLGSGEWLGAEKILWQEFLGQPDPAAYWSLWTYYLENPVHMARTGTGWAQTCTYSPDGTKLLVGTREGLLSLYEPGVRAPLYVRQTDAGAVLLAEFTPQGETFVTASANGQVGLWNASQGRLLVSRRVTDSQVTCGVIAPDQRWLAAASAEGAITIWDIATLLARTDLDDDEAVRHARTRELTYPGAVDALAVSQDDRWLAAAGENADVLIWRYPYEDAPVSLPAGPRGVISLAFSPDGSLLACGGFGDVSLWDVNEARPLWKASIHSRWVNTLTFAPGGRFLVTAGWDGSACVLNTSDGQVIRVFYGFATALYALAFSPEGDDLTIGAIGQLRTVQPLKREALVVRRDLPKAEPRAIALNDARAIIAYAAGENGAVELASLVDGSVEVLPTHHGARVDCLTFSPDGATLVSGDEAGMLCRTRLDSPGETRRAHAHQGRLRCVTFSPNGSALVTGGDDGDIILRNAETLGEFARLRGHQGAVRCVAFSSDGSLLASGGADFKLIVRDLRSRTVVFEAPALEWVNAVAFTVDGRYVISSGADLWLRFHDTSGQVVRMQGRPHEHWVNCMAVAPSGDVLVTGGHDRSLKLWALPDMMELTSIPSAQGSVYAVVLSRNGRYLAVGAEGGVTVYDCRVPDRLMRNNVEFAVHKYVPTLDDASAETANRRAAVMKELDRRWPDPTPPTAEESASRR